MEQTTDLYQPTNLTNQKPENVLLGTLGAIVCALAGAVVYFILYQANIIAWLSGLAGIFCSYWGYGKFSGNKASKKGLIIALICTVLALILAEFVCIAYELYGALDELAYTGYVVTVGDAISGTFERLKGNGVVDLLLVNGRIALVWGDYGDQAEVLLEVGKELGLSLLFCALGVVGFVRTKLAAAKSAEANNQPPQSPIEF